MSKLFFGIEGAEEDAVEPTDIDQFEGEGATASGIEPGGGVLLSQGEELLALAHLRSGQRSFEELRGEDLHVRAELTRPADDAATSAEGVGRLLSRVVVWVGRATAARCCRGCTFTSSPLPAELHETAVAATSSFVPGGQVVDGTE